MKTLSIAEAKNTLPSAIHDAEAGEDIEITRHGHPVAILMSRDRYQRLATGRNGFRGALRAFLDGNPGNEETSLQDGEADSWRDRAPAREQDPFE